MRLGVVKSVSKHTEQKIQTCFPTFSKVVIISPFSVVYERYVHTKNVVFPMSACIKSSREM